MTTPDKAMLLDKVRAMLALAESERELGHTEAADHAVATAARWMAKHGIDKALAEAKAGTRAKPGDRKFRIQAPYADAKRSLLAVVGSAFGCQAVIIATRGGDETLHMFGFDTDLEQVELLYTSLLLQMATALEHHPIARHIRGRQLMAERRSFMLGFASGVKPRLVAAYAQAVAEADDTGTVGKELVLVRREADVKDTLSAAYPHTRKIRTTYRGGSYGDGKAAGERANIHDRAGVGSGSRQIGR